MSKSISNKNFAIEPQEAVDFHLRSAWLGVSRMYNEIALKYDLTMSMAFILINVSKKGSNPTKIGPAMGMQANSLSRTLKTLEDKGLIIRKKAPDDKREIYIFLTEEGVKARKFANSIIADFNQMVYSKVEPEQMKVFLQVFDQIYGTIDEMRERLIPKEV